MEIFDDINDSDLDVLLGELSIEEDIEDLVDGSQIRSDRV